MLSKSVHIYKMKVGQPKATQKMGTSEQMQLGPKGNHAFGAEYIKSTKAIISAITLPPFDKYYSFPSEVT